MFDSYFIHATKINISTLINNLACLFFQWSISIFWKWIIVWSLCNSKMVGWEKERQLCWIFNSNTRNLCALLGIAIEILQFSRLERWFTCFFSMVFMHIVFKLYFTEEKNLQSKLSYSFFFKFKHSSRTFILMSTRCLRSECSTW